MSGRGVALLARVAVLGPAVVLAGSGGAGDPAGLPLAAVAAGVLGWATITALVLLAGSRLRRSRRRPRADGGRRPLR